MEGNLPSLFCFTLYLRAISKYNPGGGGGLYMEGLIFGILRYLHVPCSRLLSVTWRGSNRKEIQRAQLQLSSHFCQLMFLLYHPLSNGREDTFVYWVSHLDVFSLISSYRVELFLLHLKVIDGKFKERPFSPIRISVAFLWTPRHFCLERIGIK